MGTFEDLLKRGKIKPEDLPDDVASCDDLRTTLAAEIKMIEEQLALEEKGITSFSVNDHTWPQRALAALKMKRFRRAAVSRHRARLDRTRRNQADADRKAESARNRERNQREWQAAEDRRAERAKAHRENIEAEAEVCIRVVRNALNRLPEQIRDEIFKEMNEAVAVARRMRGDK